MKRICLLILFILASSETWGADDISFDNKKRSLEIARQASMLLRDGQLNDALIAYNNADMLSADESLRKTIAEIKERIAKDTEDKAAADSLRRQAILHISDGHLLLAIEKLQESLIYYDNADVRSELGMIEGRYKAERQKQKIAEEMLQIAEQLENRDEYEAALSKIEEARTVWDLAQISHVRQRIEKKLEKRRSDNQEAAKLAHEAAKLRIKASTEQRDDMNLLQQALEKYEKSYSINPIPAVEMAITQTEHFILNISMDIREAERKAKEARLLEGQGKYEAALEVYNISIRLRQNEEVSKELAALEKKISQEYMRDKQANDLYSEAAKLEVNGKLREALLTVNRALEISPKPEGEALKLRLEKTITERDQRKAKGAELAEKANVLRSQKSFDLALDMYWESWAVWPYSSEIKDAIDSLESTVKDVKTTENRAKKLYNEGLALEGEGRLLEAIERITGSLALIPSKEAEEKLTSLKKSLSNKQWLDALLMQPLELKSEPVLPMVGQIVTVRIEGSNWLDSERLTYKWEISENARDVKSIDLGKAVDLRASDEAPVIIKLEVYSKEIKDLKAPIIEKRFSIIAGSYNVRINVAGMNSKHQKWNPVKKQLEPFNELVTRSDILLQASTSPSIENAFYEWKIDEETFVSGDKGEYEINVRRNVPGLSKIGVIIKDQFGIVLGNAETSFLVPVAYEDVLIGLQRSEAWALWLESQELWKEQRRSDAIKKASEASTLDPSDHDITIGLSELYNENAKIEEAFYLAALSSLRKLEERYDEAILTLKESQRLYPEESKRLHILNMENEVNKMQDKTALAEKLCAEGDWLLGQQRKVEAISKFRESLMLQKDKALSEKVIKLTAEVEKENQIRDKRKELLQTSFSLISKQRYTEALESMTQTLSLHEDDAIKAYIEIVKQKTDEEEKLKQQASLIRKEADSLFKDSKYEEAFVLYHRSFGIWKNDELESWLAKEEQTYNEAQALKYRKEAEQFLRRNRREDALRAYRSSLKYAFDKAADDYVREADAHAARVRADELVSEAEALLKQKKPEEALEKYKLALPKVPNDSKIISAIEKLELSLMKAVSEPNENDATLSVDKHPEYTVSDDGSEQLIAADVIFREANALYSQQKYSEALSKYKQSYELSNNSKLKEFIDRLEKAIDDVERANALVRNANELYRQGKFSEALKNYEESLSIYKNPKVEEFIKKLKNLIE